MPRTWLGALGALICIVTGAGSAEAQDKIRVVTTFSILADFAKNVGGDAVEVASLVGPDSDAHAYSPSPADGKRLADAKLVLVNGLGFEGWMDRLVKASGTKAVVVTASRGVKPRQMTEEDEHDHGKTDPHAWQSVANAKIYVANVRDALVQVDPAGKAAYEANAAAYLAKLDQLENDVKATIAAIPTARRKIITTHDAFGYFGAAYRMQFIAPQGVSTETEVSARDVAKIIRQIRTQKIPAVFMENVTDPRLMKRIAEEGGAKIGGKLYSDALSGPDGPAATYLDMMRSNLKEFQSALTN
ncbi:MAG: metal ABC transporter substrate-binding protein [Xanthobacteraceae bacterium]|jgi:zinc/manganese transport system substrate-binding protein